MGWLGGAGDGGEDWRQTQGSKTLAGGIRIPSGRYRRRFYAGNGSPIRPPAVNQLPDLNIWISPDADHGSGYAGLKEPARHRGVEPVFAEY